MNRILRKLLTFEVGDVVIRGKIAIGAAGAVGTITPPGGASGAINHAIKSVVRNSAGNYTITFADAYPDFHYVRAGVEFPSAGAVQTPGIQARVWAYTPTPASGGATMVVQVVTTSAAAAPEVAVDPPNGSELHFEVFAKNSKIGVGG